jgi:hypothetical protein
VVSSTGRRRNLIWNYGEENGEGNRWQKEDYIIRGRAGYELGAQREMGERRRGSFWSVHVVYGQNVGILGCSMYSAVISIVASCLYL